MEDIFTGWKCYVLQYNDLSLSSNIAFYLLIKVSYSMCFIFVMKLAHPDHMHAVSAFRILSVRAESVGTTGASRFNKTSLLVYSHVGRQSDKWVSAYFVT